MITPACAIDIIKGVTDRAVLRVVGPVHIELRVPDDCVEDMRAVVYEKFPAIYRVDVKPLSHESAYTSRIVIFG